MPLDPDVKRFLDMVAAADTPPVASLSPRAMREGFRRLAAMADARGVTVASSEDLHLPGPGGPLPARIYKPIATGGGARPGLVYFHGGGGIFGSVETYDGVCRTLCDASQCAVVSVDYRLAPEHPFPAAVEDAYAATAWVAGEAARLGIDAHRIAVAGDSAGGCLAAVACQLSLARGGPKIALQVLLCPVLDMAAKTASRRDFADGYFLTQETIDWIMRNGLAPGDDVGDPRISPLRARDFSDLPPAHVHTAEFDPLRDEGKAYADVLAQAGVPVRYRCHVGMIHHFYGLTGIIPAARAATRAAGEAVRDALI